MTVGREVSGSFCGNVMICNKPFAYWRQLFHLTHQIHYFSHPTGRIFSYYVQVVHEDLPYQYQTILTRIRNCLNNHTLGAK